MHPTRSLSAVLLLAVLAIPAATSAQDAGSALRFDLGVGIGTGRGGGLRDLRGGVAASSMLSWRIRRSSTTPLTLGVNASGQYVFDGSDDCLLGPLDGCVPNYPDMQSVGLLIGVAGGDSRLLVGPAFFHAKETGNAPGLQGRIDVAMPARARLAVTLWLQGALGPRLKGETYTVGSAGLGLRLR